MKVSQVNGFSRVNVKQAPSNGFSRVNYKGTVQPVNALELNALMLNGYVVNGIDEMTDEEFEMFLSALDNTGANDLALNGLFSKLRDRIRKTRKARQARRAQRKAARQEKRELRNERLRARIERIRSKAGKPGFLDKLADVGKAAFSGITGGAMEELETLPGIAADQLDFGGDNELTPGEQKGLNLFGPPKYEPWNPKWWSKKRVPTIQKIGTVAGALVVVDVLRKGKVREAIGLKKKTKRRR